MTISSTYSTLSRPTRVNTGIFRRVFVAVRTMCAILWGGFGGNPLLNVYTMTIISCVHSLTFPTLSTVFADKQVRARQWMSAFAVRLARMFSLNAFAPQHIFTWSDGFNVNGVYAMPNPTQMIAMQGGWNEFHEHLVQKPMHTIVNAVNRNSTVPRTQFTLPFPTGSALKVIGSADLNCREYLCKQLGISKETIAVLFVPLFFESLRDFVLLYARLSFPATGGIPSSFSWGFVDAEATIRRLSVTGGGYIMKINQRTRAFTKGASFFYNRDSHLFKAPILNNLIRPVDALVAYLRAVSIVSRTRSFV